jgi:hypothetical protein
MEATLKRQFAIPIDSNVDFYVKYLKYKQKYLDLGGGSGGMRYDKRKGTTPTAKFINCSDDSIVNHIPVLFTFLESYINKNYGGVFTSILDYFKSHITTPSIEITDLYDDKISPDDKHLKPLLIKTGVQNHAIMIYVDLKSNTYTIINTGLGLENHNDHYHMDNNIKLTNLWKTFSCNNMDLLLKYLQMYNKFLILDPSMIKNNTDELPYDENSDVYTHVLNIYTALNNTIQYNQLNFLYNDPPSYLKSTKSDNNVESIDDIDRLFKQYNHIGTLKDRNIISHEQNIYTTPQIARSCTWFSLFWGYFYHLIKNEDKYIEKLKAILDNLITQKNRLFSEKSYYIQNKTELIMINYHLIEILKNIPEIETSNLIDFNTLLKRDYSIHVLKHFNEEIKIITIDFATTIYDDKIAWAFVLTNYATYIKEQVDAVINSLEYDNYEININYTNKYYYMERQLRFGRLSGLVSPIGQDLT